MSTWKWAASALGAILASLSAGVQDRRDAMLTVPKDKLPVVEKERLERWREAEVHWANIDALRESVEAVMADRVIDQAESRDLCFKAE